MSLGTPLINPDLDLAQHARTFRDHTRVQLRDFLTPEWAQQLRAALEREVAWGFAFKGQGSPQSLSEAQVTQLSAEQRRAVANDVQQTAARGQYAVRFNQFDILGTYLAKQQRDTVLDRFLETINTPAVLDVMRQVTGIPALIKADAQATLFGPGDFLSLHSDSHKAEGWRVAYVLNLADPAWSPDWGGYLNFFDAEGDLVAGWKPRFNALNLFLVPQPHHVSYVPPFAPQQRFAITGWLRDR